LLAADDAGLRRGYDEGLRCLFCDAVSAGESGARAHLAQAHGSALEALLALEKGLTGLTDTQKSLILQWKAGAADADIAAARGVSVSTVRNQRFALRAREREARLLLAILALAGLSAPPRARRAAPEAGQDEADRFFRDGRLTVLPARAQKRRAVMRRIAALFDPGRAYAEREVRELLTQVWPDYALVRRALVDDGLLRRTADGRSYWRVAEPASPEPIQEEANPTMPIDKKAARQAYKHTIPPMGLYCLRDRRSGRCVIAGDRNLNSVMGRFRFLMGGPAAQPAGPFSDPALYADYRDHPDDFTFEVLESVDVAKCATYEEAADKLDALLKEALPRYADRARYAQK
jgi:DNA-binding CsgD family transcriptional regulator